jgi:hypothetical protein
MLPYPLSHPLPYGPDFEADDLSALQNSFSLGSNQITLIMPLMLRVFALSSSDSLVCRPISIQSEGSFPDLVNVARLEVCSVCGRG